MTKRIASPPEPKTRPDDERQESQPKPMDKHLDEHWDRHRDAMNKLERNRTTMKHQPDPSAPPITLPVEIVENE